MLAIFQQNFPTLGDGVTLLLDEPEMALSASNQRRILKMLKELADQRGFRVICATHSPVLINDSQTYVINLDRHVNRNVPLQSFGSEDANTIQ
jgi:predicted ATPase